MLKDYFSNIDDKKLNLLQKLLEEIKSWNQKINLISFKDDQELIIKHFLDSAFLLNFIDLKGNVLDLGTGGGFPGLVLAILKPEVNFTLLDATNKKIEALKEIAQNLNLKNVNFLNGRAEELAQNLKYREQFETVLARAVANLSVLLELIAGFVMIDGQFIAFKGPDYEKELKTSKKAAEILKMKFEQKFEYELPENMGERVYLRYKKEELLDKKYPRRVGMPNKKPLA